MHLQEKIYEAIQRGLTKGLDFSFDDEMDLQNIPKKKVINSEERTRWFRENMVDLGLSSGRLWCKYNLGATHEDTAKSWYGNYYAWGELEPKDDYKHDTYTCDLKNTDTLPDEYDAAQQFHYMLHIPTIEDVTELLKLKNSWTFCYNGIKNLSGRVFEGKNGNELFIPTAGMYKNSWPESTEWRGYVWISNEGPLATEGAALYIDQTSRLISSSTKFYGLPIRPVA